MKGNSLEAAAVYRPTALRGAGAWYQQLRISPCRSRDTADAFFSCAEEMLYASRGLRRGGSAALDICCAGISTDFFNRPCKLFPVLSLAAALPGVQSQMLMIIEKNYTAVLRLDLPSRS